MTKHKPPSRERYEKTHPTISFRLDLNTKKRLEEVLEEESFADFVKEAIGVREREKESINKAYNRGHRDGYNEARQHYETYYYCTFCGERITITQQNEKQAINHYMREHRWAHHDCIENMHHMHQRRRKHYYYHP